MSFNVGVNVLETDGKATPSIQAAPTSVAAFIIRAQRGLANTVRMITSPAQFREHFGSYLEGAYGAYALRGFFDNGGTVAHVVRIVDDTTAVASHRQFGTALTVTAAYRGTDDGGAWGNGIGIRIALNAEDANTYDLFVRYNRAVVETWTGLNHSTATGATGSHPKSVINDSFSGSKFISVSEDTTSNPETTDGAPGADPHGFIDLTDGAEDSLSAADLQTAFTNALDLFDTIDVQLVTCPETTDADFVAAALQKCSGRGDCLFVGHTEPNIDKDAAKMYGKSFQGDKVYGALYWPWIQVLDPIGTRRWIPPTGHVLGVYARTERERGIWKAPAGNAARLGAALDVRANITDVDHTDLVKNGGVNAVRFIPGQGIVVDSSRTLSTSPLWLYVNVRLLFNFVKTSLKYGLRWVVQEPNSEELWNKVKFNSVTPFLMGLWRKGAFGPGKPEQVFTVKCDSDTNPPANIQQGIFTVEVYFYPSRPAETVVIVVGQQEGAASATE